MYMYLQRDVRLSVLHQDTNLWLWVKCSTDLFRALRVQGACTCSVVPRSLLWTRTATQTSRLNFRLFVHHLSTKALLIRSLCLNNLDYRSPRPKILNYGGKNPKITVLEGNKKPKPNKRTWNCFLKVNKLAVLWFLRILADFRIFYKSPFA